MQYLLFDNKIDTDTLIDIRMVYAHSEHAFGPHRDSGNHKSSDNYITLHLNAWIYHIFLEIINLDLG